MSSYFQPDWVDQFTKETTDTNDNYGLPYDYGSIMHYGATRCVSVNCVVLIIFFSRECYYCSATENEKPTMVPRDAQYTQTLGSPFVSFYELLMLNKHYNCLGW